MNPHESPPTSLRVMFSSLMSNRELIATLTRREIASRYRGSFLGVAWSLVTPVLMLIIYTFVFSVVFKVRWGMGGEDGKTDFAMLLFVGLILHGLFAECVNRAPGLIIANTNYVKKVIFPLEILPWVVMGGALFNTGISVVVLLTAQILLKHALPWTVILFPIVVAPLVLAAVGATLFLAAIGVFLRDIGHTVSIFTTMLLFVSAVFYPISALPDQYQLFIKLNPLAFIIEQCRKILIFGQLPDWPGYALVLLGSLGLTWIGFWWFQKSRKGFADVI